MMGRWLGHLGLLGIGLALLAGCRSEPAPAGEEASAGPPIEAAVAEAEVPKEAEAAPEPEKAPDPAAEFGAHPPEEVRRWNVVLITADTLRGDMLEVNGNTEVRSPRLTALAQEGVNFRRAYANITTTTPAHASIFSSLYPQDHRAYGNQDRLSDEIVMLPEVLKEAGWHTAAYLNMPWLNREVSNIPQGIDEIDPGNRIRKADATNRWVLDFFDRRKDADQPFYLWIQYVDNHTPYHAPGKYDRMYYPEDRDPRAGERGSLQEIWPRFPIDLRDNEFVERWLRGITDKDYIIGHYKGSVTWIDEKVGELIDRLKENGQWENTLFVFTSDHGESLGEHDIWFSHGGLYEVTTRIPLIVRAPVGPRDRHLDAIASQVDIMPTILSMLGLDVPEQARGHDLWSAARGETSGPMAAFLEHTGRQLTGVVTPQFKYIKHLRTRRDIYPGYPIVRGTVELYDLEKDPDELQNLAESMPEVVERLERLHAELAAGERAFVAEQAEIDEETEEALRALGYIQ
jgi:arylsulfatase